MFTVTDTVSFDIDDAEIIEALKENFLSEDGDNDEVDEEGVREFIFDYLCENEYDLCQYADYWGGQDWLTEEIIDPIIENFFNSI